MIRRALITVILAAVAASCSRPSSYEPFIMREKAEYGDTYSFILEFHDSSATYGLDFYTRLERPAFGEYPSDSIVLDLRWIAPTDSILADTSVIHLHFPSDSAYYSKDFISPYGGRLGLPSKGRWRLKARVVNDSQAIRGLGVIFKGNRWDTTN